ncbi:MAG: methyltransferase domain-containing protein [Actinobacteria bacterium]|nr:methyltransferase domain-containing protein [Actinomycetota bacterium]
MAPAPNKKLEELLLEAKLLGDIKRKAEKEKIPVIDEDTGRFLEAISFVKKPREILEIGCGSGFSSYFLVKNLEDGSYTGIDLNKERLKRAEEFIKNKFPDKKVRFLSGNAIKIIPSLDKRFDMVFIDAAKYEYPLYIKVLDGKLSKGAIVIADNIFYQHKVFKKELSKHDYNSVAGIRGYIDFVTNSKDFRTELINIGDGISISEFVGI